MKGNEKLHVGLFFAPSARCESVLFHANMNCLNCYAVRLDDKKNYQKGIERRAKKKKLSGKNYQHQRHFYCNIHAEP